MTKNPAIPVLAFLLGACAGTTPPPSTIEASDNGVIVPAARMSLDLRDAGGARAEPKRGHALEAGWSRGEGGDSQSVPAANRPVVFGGQTFNAPVALRHEFEYSFLELAYRYRLILQPDQPGLEVRGGVAQARLDLTVASPSQRAHEKLESEGFIGSLGALVLVAPRTSLQGRITFFVSGSGSGVSEANRVELHGARTLGRNAALRAGWVHWNVKSERDSTSSSIKVKFSGPSLGLDVAL